MSQTTLAEYEAMGDDVPEGHSLQSAAIRHLIRALRAACEDLTSQDDYEDYEADIERLAEDHLAETEDA